MDVNDLRNKAYEIYKLTISEPAFGDFKGGDYWKIGCIFDTLTDYLQQDSLLSSPKVSPAEVKAFMAKSYDFYQSLVTQTDPNYSWYDDFAWWGIACSKAFWPGFIGIFGDLSNRYKRICLSTWDVMKNGKCDHVHFGAPNAWDVCDKKWFAGCEPKIAGGVWQYDIVADPHPYDDSSSNPSTPIDLPARTVAYKFGKDEYGREVSRSIDLPAYPAVSLGPYQLTVVNGLYFVLANRLVGLGFEDRKTADGILNFFVNWFKVPDVPQLYQTVTGGRLIRERVSKYANGTEVNDWDGQNSWGGDQGLLLGALADYKRQHGAAPGIDIDAWIKDLMGGVARTMRKSDGGFNFMMPWFPFDAPLFEDTDPGDYSSGIGVYMRYLNYAYSFNSAVQAALKNPMSSERALVLDSAATVMAGKLPRWQANGIYPFEYFNQLAILVMAISLLNPKS